MIKINFDNIIYIFIELYFININDSLNIIYILDFGIKKWIIF